MTSPASAILWQFGRRHRWGFRIFGLYLVALAILKLRYDGGPVQFHEGFAFTVLVPLSLMFMYFLALFSYGLDGDLAARKSAYPERMLTLPLTTAALAGWPMLFGVLAMALLWLAMRTLAVWPSNVAMPVVWPALLGASLMAWTQAMTWRPYGWRGVRIVLTTLLLSSLDAVVITAMELRASEGAMLLLLAPQVPLAYVVARRGLARARRGEVPEWRGIRRAASVSTDQPAFASALRAQAWLEWREHGRSLPLLVALLLPFELAMLYLFRETPVIVYETLTLILLTPAILGRFVAAMAGKGNALLVATRPLSDAELLAVKLKAAAKSAAVTWALVLVTLPIALFVTGTWETAMAFPEWVWRAFGMPRAIAFFVLALVLLAGSTWKQLAQALSLRMSRREWLPKASVFSTLLAMCLFILTSNWLLWNRRHAALLWDALPAIMAVLAAVKVCLGASLVMRWRIVGERVAITAAASWTAAVLAVYATLAWILPELIVRRHILTLIAILTVPLARLATTPLALASHRHG